MSMTWHCNGNRSVHGRQMDLAGCVPVDEFRSQRGKVVSSSSLPILRDE